MKITWNTGVLGLIGSALGLVLSILAAYWKAYVFGGIEEETFGLYAILFVVVFGGLGIFIGIKIDRQKSRP